MVKTENEKLKVDQEFYQTQLTRQKIRKRTFIGVLSSLALVMITMLVIKVNNPQSEILQPLANTSAQSVGVEEPKPADHITEHADAKQIVAEASLSLNSATSDSKISYTGNTTEISVNLKNKGEQIEGNSGLVNITETSE